MAKKTKVATNDKNEKVVAETDKAVEILEKSNLELENKIKELAEVVDGLLNERKEINKVVEDLLNEKKEVSKSTEEITLKYSEIEPTRRVLLMNMVNAGATYKTYSGKVIRFDRFGQVQPARFEDLESLVSIYRNYFENIEVRIINDDDVIDALYLRNSYDSHDISKEEMENIISLDPQSMIKKIKLLSVPLQQSVISLVINGISNGEKKYMDKNKWDVIESTYNIDLNGIVAKYFRQ